MDMTGSQVQFEATDIKIRKENKFFPFCPFPIGFIYMSTQNVSPASLYGGTWTQISDSKFWLPSTSYGSSSGSTSITTSNLPAHSHTGTTKKDGGHDHTVTGTVSSHTHGFNYFLLSASADTQNADMYDGKLTGSGYKVPRFPDTTSLGSWIKTTNNTQPTFSSGRAWSGNASAGDYMSQHTHAFTTNNTGSGSAYWQPYRTCYCWIRTA